MWLHDMVVYWLCYAVWSVSCDCVTCDTQSGVYVICSLWWFSSQQKTRVKAQGQPTREREEGMLSQLFTQSLIHSVRHTVSSQITWCKDVRYSTLTYIDMAWGSSLILIFLCLCLTHLPPAHSHPYLPSEHQKSRWYSECLRHLFSTSSNAVTVSKGHCYDPKPFYSHDTRDKV